MKRTISAILGVILLLLSAQDARSTTASPKPFKYKQPDGSVVTVQLHGDEFFHWETIGEKTVVMDSKGFYREEDVASLKSRQMMAAGMVKSRKPVRSISPNSVTRDGDPHFLILLIEFSDLSFTVNDPQTAFGNLLNEAGYSANGGTGSVKDYFRDNSCGRFNPVFDIAGPVRLSRSYTYYGSSDSNTRNALDEACGLIDSEVDFSRYDGDGDGIVDNVFFFFAGHNEAEGGGTLTIWPHSWNIYDLNRICDGVRISQYACTSEYRGASGKEMCGIGTFCHEFGHTLGLPDLYDTDYSSHGQAFTMSCYSLMCSGNYNNNGCTPPFLLGIERMMLGWMAEPEIWTTGGQKIVEPVSDNKTYRTRTATEGEWFVFETRNGKSWDSPLPAGMIVTHIDQSDRDVYGMTARERWENWCINIFGDHPCCYIVAADDKSIESYPFPGSMGHKEFSSDSYPAFLDWDGNHTGYEISSIQFDGERTSLTLSLERQLKLRGNVSLMDGTPVQGISVSISDATGSMVRTSEATSSKAASSAAVSTSTDEYGNYVMKLDDNLIGKTVNVSVSGAGYRSQSVTVKISDGSNKADFIVRKIDDTSEIQLKKYNDNARWSYGFNYSPQSIQAAVRFSPSELKSYEGEQLASITFEMTGRSSDEVRVFVEIDGSRVLDRVVTGPVYSGTNTVDISKNNITVPSGKTMHIGYSVKNMDDHFPISIDGGPGVKGGLCYSEYFDNCAKWNHDEGYNAIIGAKLLLNRDISEIGYNYVALGDSEYRTGDEFVFRLVTGSNPPASVEWFFDGQAHNGDKITLAKGRHEIKALLKYNDNSTETLFAEIYAE